MPTKIEWAEETWNPVTGCTKISAGCQHCYAERMARRLAGRHGYPEAPHHFDVTLRPERLNEPLHWRESRRVFVVSMGDLFHEDVPYSYINQVFEVMEQAPQHTFQVLTKRPRRMMEYLRWWQEMEGCAFDVPNIWLGVTAENQEMADKRVPALLNCPAKVRFVSCEPLLGEIDISPWLEYNTHKGESGYGKRTGPLQASGDGRMEDRRCRKGMVEQGRRVEEGRASDAAGVSPSSQDDQRSSSPHGSASLGVPSFQGSDPTRPRDQSPKRGQGRQSSGESGDCDQLRECETRLCHRTKESRRAKESSQQTIRRSGRGNQGPLCQGRHNTEATWAGVRSGIPDYIQDCERGTPPDAEWKNGRLFAPSQQASTEKSKRSIHLIIVGGESGPGARPMHPDWARSLRDQCRDAGVPFFFKQHGAWIQQETYPGDDWSQVAFMDTDGNMCEPGKGDTFWRVGKKRSGRLLDGREWNEYPGASQC